MLQPLDGPAKQFSVSVDTVTVLKVQKDASPLVERKVVTIQPDGKIYVYFGDEGATPNAATVTSDGFIHFKNAKISYEASDTQILYMIAEAGTVTVRGAERA